MDPERFELRTGSQAQLRMLKLLVFGGVGLNLDTLMVWILDGISCV